MKRVVRMNTDDELGRKTIWSNKLIYVVIFSNIFITTTMSVQII